jgi:ribosomal subunit interface protein
VFEYKKIKKESRMDIQVSGKQLKIGKSLTDYTKEHLDIINKKYLLRPTFANITFTKENNEFKCEALLHLSSGLTACCTGRAREIYNSYQKSIFRLEKIIRRDKRTIRNHHQISKKFDMDLR